MLARYCGLYAPRAMGQPITVSQKPSRRPGIVRFELNRVLTGMGHEDYRSAADATGHRPPDQLARRLFEHKAVKAVHIFSNEVTIELNAWTAPDGLKESIEGLYIHYLPGVQPSIPANGAERPNT
ncbi:MAG: hypothetical protein ACRDZ8_20240 [Acidimicrobiales bacterium]